MTLRTALDNAEYALGDLLPELAAGRLTKARQIHALCAYFRCRGVCRLLLEGTPDGLHVNQMQEAGAYLFWLRQADEAQKVTSWANPFYAAVAGGFDGAAKDIAHHSRMSFNPDMEHEDNFLYVAFLMQRYVLGADEAAQRASLDSYAEVLEGKHDSRFELCSAALEGDIAALEAQLVDVLDERQAKVDAMIEQGKMPDDYSKWIRPVGLEPLALLRFAEQEGATVAGPAPGAPPAAQSRSTLRFNADAWRSLDYAP